MEPFSIATGVVGVLAAIDQAQKCVRKLRTLRNAHAEVMQLAEDVSDLHQTLVQVAQLVDSRELRRSSSSSNRINWPPGALRTDALDVLEHLGSKAAAKLERLADLIPAGSTAASSSSSSAAEGKQGGGGGTGGRVSRILLINEERLHWNRNRATAQRLLADLRGIQLNVLVNLSVLSASAGVETRTFTPSEAQMKITDEEQEIGFHGLAAGTDESPDADSLAESTETSIVSQRQLRLLRDNKAGLSSADLKKEHSDAQIVASSRNICEDWCSCRCHKRTLLWLNNRGAWLDGSFFLLWGGQVFGISTCNEQACRRNRRRTIKLKFKPPKWLLQSQFQFVYHSDPLYGVNLSVRLPRSLGFEAPVWKKACMGDNVAIRRMFDNGEASPFDLNPFGGSLLHYAADRCNFDLCRLLIERGAEPFIVDEIGTNPTWTVWEQLLAGRLNDEESMFVREFFDGDEYVESRQFTVLQKVTLGLTKLDLTAMLEISTADIDAVDTEGKTCLAWASIIGDAAAMKTLLEYGADPNIADMWKKSPLHHARTAECCELLLQYGADITAQDQVGRSVLHWLGRVPQDYCSVIRPLLAWGINPNVRDNVGETALISACGAGFEGCASCVTEILKGPLDATNGGLDLIKCFSDAITHGSNIACLESLRDYCEGFSKFAHVLPPDSERPWTASNMPAGLVEYFETKGKYHNVLGEDHDAMERRLRQQAIDFFERFGEPPESAELTDAAEEELEIFLDAAEKFA